MKFEWSDDLLTGLGIIDDQHKKLVERIRSFIDAVENDDIDVIEDTIDYLIGYTIQHFGSEEMIMVKHGYDEFKSHRDEHSWFIKMVYDAKKAVLSRNFSEEQLINIRDDLVNWTLTHIKIKDKRIAEHIQY